MRAEVYHIQETVYSYLWVIFMGDCVKCRPRRIIDNIGLVRILEKVGEIKEYNNLHSR